MSGFVITYDRAWEWTELAGPVYAPPVLLPPVLRATPVPPDFSWPQVVLDARGGQPPKVPPGARALVKAVAGSGADVIVSYARGYDVDAKGENVRKPIWESVTTAATDEDAERKKRVKVGEMDPVPVDSIAVAAVWRTGTVPEIFADGWWIDATPQRSRVWSSGGRLEHLGWTPFLKRVKEIADGRRGLF